MMGESLVETFHIVKFTKNIQEEIFVLLEIVKIRYNAILDEKKDIKHDSFVV